MNEFDKADFDEEVLKHLVRSDEVMSRAKELGMKGDDFLSSNIAGVKLYKVFGSAVIQIGKAPVSRKLLENKVREACKFEGIPEVESLTELVDWCFDSPLNTEYIVQNLHGFVRHRRLIKVAEVHKDDLSTMSTEFDKIAIDLNKSETKQKLISAKPFEKPVYVKHISGICTGFNAIDNVVHGLAKEECGLVIGHSGSGKTAVTSAMARFAALNGYKALYISLEEPHQNIIHRWYASQFRIPYTQLHYGLENNQSSSKLDLEVLFQEMEPETRETLLNLDIVDARAMTPINTAKIKEILEQKVAEGFIPDVVYIDQLDYITPTAALPKGAQPYMAYEKSAFELDLLSQYKIAGEHTFALWVIHQGKGGMKWEFGYDDIAGFRGIVKPFDICLGIGRHDKDTPYINLFSMKVRHTQHVRQSYRAEFQYMSFSQQQWSPERLKEEEREAKKAQGLESERKKPGDRRPKPYLKNGSNG